MTLRSNWREKELFRIDEEKEGGIIQIETNSPPNFNPTQLRCTLRSLSPLSLEYQPKKSVEILIFGHCVTYHWGETNRAIRPYQLPNYQRCKQPHEPLLPEGEVHKDR